MRVHLKLARDTSAMSTRISLSFWRPGTAHVQVGDGSCRPRVPFAAATVRVPGRGWHTLRLAGPETMRRPFLEQPLQSSSCSCGMWLCVSVMNG